MIQGPDSDAFRDSSVRTGAVAPMFQAAPSYIGPLISAGFWRRVVAFCIDANCILLIRCELSLVWALAVSEYTAKIVQHFHLFIIVFSTVGYILLSALTGILYYAAFEASYYRATPGKIVMHAYLSDSTGAPISFLRSVGRNCAKIFSVLPLGLGFLLAAFTSRKQALHDLVAGTMVLRRNGASASRFVVGITLAVATGFLAQVVSERSERSIHNLRSDFEAQRGNSMRPPEDQLLDNDSTDSPPEDERFDDADGGPYDALSEGTRI